MALAGETYVIVADGVRLVAAAIPADRPIVIGRADDADVVVEDAKASRHHARIERRGERVMLVDLGSRNGTKLGGAVVRSEERVLAPGDVIGIGSATLTIASAPGARRLQTDRPDADATATQRADFVVADPAMLEVFRVAERFARSDTAVLVVGETGVGKEVLAARIHEMSPRRHGPFVSLVCAALADTILESELFGHEKGAFTGADRRKIGFLEAAGGGTLLLDELGDIPLATQVKLLRFLETRRLTRLGSTDEIPVDVRIVAATHRDLTRAIREGRFREDLYYRLSACMLKVPPLRERPAEVASLAALFAQRAAAKLGRAAPTFEPAVLSMLLGYTWPGNIRELRNAIEHAVVMSDGHTVRADALPEAVRSAVGASPKAQSGAGTGVLPAELASVERERIERALEEEGHNQTRAAARLGISRRALLYKMAKHRIESRHPRRSREEP